MNLQKSPPVIAYRYRLSETLTTSRSAVVYRAYDILTGKTVALKRLAYSTALIGQEETARVNITREFQDLASLYHPNIVEVIDYGIDAQRNPFFTMEYVEGTRDLLTAGRDLSLVDKVKLLVQVLHALEYLHGKGLVHRNILPANLLVTANGQVKLTDFGMLSGSGGDWANTPIYAAPELLARHPETPQSDLYALGVIAYQLIAGRAPFAPDSPPLDAPPALTEIILRLLAASPEQRPTSAGAVIDGVRAAVGIPTADDTVRADTVQRINFIGREVEFARLKLAYEQAARGHGTCWLVGGESGVGKSRLLGEIRLHALAAGALVLVGQGIAEGGQPYQLWREPLRRLALTADLTDADAGVLKDLIPDLEAILGRAVPDAPALDGADQQRRLIATITRLLLRQNQPVLLILEDVQWAIESLAPLKALIGLVSDLPVMILGSFRADEAPSLPDQLPGMELLLLERFDAATTARLSAALLRDLEPGLARWIQQETEGNAFFIVEAVRALLAETGNGAARRLTGVNAMIQRRLARLPAPARPVLELAAVAGRQINRAVLSAATSADIDAWLSQCESAAVLAYNAGTWAFTHDKLREAVIDALPPDRRAALHGQIAAALEAVYPGDESQAFMLYEHWRESGNRAKEADYARKAGLLRQQLSGFADARRLLERALELLDGASGSSAARVELLLALGEVCWHTSDYTAAAAYLKDGIQLAEQTNAPSSAANGLFWLSQIDSIQGHYDQARTSLFLAYNVAPPTDSRTLARIYYGLGDVAWRKDQLNEAANYIAQSLRLARLINDANLTMYALNRLGSIHFFQNELDTAEQYHRENRALALNVGNRERAIAAIGNLGEIARLRGDFPAADRLYREALDIAHEIGQRHYMTLLYGYLGLNALAAGETEAAESPLWSALKLAREQASPALMLVALGGLARLRARQGAREQAVEWLGLIVGHPATDVNIKNDVQPLYDELCQSMDAALFAAAVERGHGMTLSAEVERLLN